VYNYIDLDQNNFVISNNKLFKNVKYNCLNYFFIRKFSKYFFKNGYLNFKILNIIYKRLFLLNYKFESGIISFYSNIFFQKQSYNYNLIVNDIFKEFDFLFIFKIKWNFFYQNKRERKVPTITYGMNDSKKIEYFFKLINIIYLKKKKNSMLGSFFKYELQSQNSLLIDLNNELLEEFFKTR
jgi:hypothetical protein